MSIELDAETVERLTQDIPRLVAQAARERLAGVESDLEILHQAADRADQALLELQKLVEDGYRVKNVSQQPSQSRTPRIEPQSDINPYQHGIPAFSAMGELLGLHARLKKRESDSFHYG